MTDTLDPISRLIPEIQPDGNNNWYITNTKITFDIFDDQSSISYIFYRWNGSSTWKEFELLSHSESLFIVSEGGETTGQLTYFPIVSIILKRNAITLTRGVDYTIDLNTGLITFDITLNLLDVVTADYTYSILISNEEVIRNATGGENTAQLMHTHILLSDLDILKNGSLLVHNSAYTIDQNNGTITFTTPLSANDNITANYQYLVQDNLQSIISELVITATGGDKTFFLTIPVITSSERIYLNNLALIRTVDYTINYTTGLVTLTNELNQGDEIKATYKVSVIGETVISSADINQTNAFLQNTNIGNYAISVNAVLQRNNPEYQLIEDTGQITLLNPLIALDNIIATYQFDAVDEQTIVSANDNQTSFILHTNSILEGTERIKLNDNSLKREPYISLYSEVFYDTDIALNPVGTTQQLAQGFQSPINTDIGGIQLYLKKIGTLTGTLTLEIQTDTAGSPSGTAILNGISNTITADSMGSSYSWINFVFNKPIIAQTTQYHIVLKSSGYTYALGTTEIIWGVDTTLLGYTNGEFKNYTGAIWNSYGADAMFVIHDAGDEYQIDMANGLVYLNPFFFPTGMQKFDRILSDYRAQIINETVVYSALGSEIILNLNNQNIVSNSLTLLKNTSSLDDLPEYQLNTTTGEITFTTGLSAGDTVTATYDYSLTNEIIITSASGGETVLQLDNVFIKSPIILIKNGSITLTIGVDYDIDLLNGEIILYQALQATETIHATYDYYTSIISEYAVRKSFTTYNPLIGGIDLIVQKNGNDLTENVDYTIDLINGKFDFSNISILLSDTISTSYKYGKSTIVIGEIHFGPGATFALANDQIVYNSVTIIKNATPPALIEDVDYEIDYDTGIIILTTALLITDQISISYTHGAPLTIPNDGINGIEFYAEDSVGNKEGINTFEFKLDKPISSPPYTQLDAPEGLQTSPVTIRFLTSDDISGVDRTYYTLDGSTPTTSSSSGTETIISLSGMITVKFFSVDNAGNQEAVQTEVIALEVDTEAPVISITESPQLTSTYGNNGYYRVQPTVTLSATGELNLDKIYYKLVSVDNQTTATYTSTVDLSSPVDLSTNFNIVLEIDQNDTPVSIDCRGTIAEATTISEIIAEINSATKQVLSVIAEDATTDGTFILTVINTNIESVSRIYNTTTGETYFYQSHAGDKITFIGVIAPLSTDVVEVDYEYALSDVASETDSIGNPGTGYITLISPMGGAGFATSEIKFMEPESNDSTDIIFGLAINPFPYEFRSNNSHIRVTSLVNLSGGVDLSNNFNVYIRVDGGTAIEIDCRGSIPSNTSISEIIEAINTEFSELARETALDGGIGTGYITLLSPTRGTLTLASSIAFLEPTEYDATNEIFGLNENPYPYTYTESNLFQEYIAPLVLPANGIYLLSAYGIDLNGNTGNEITKRYQIDTQIPTTNINVAGGILSNNNWYTVNPTLTFNATDNLSGIDRILYKWNSTTPPFTEYVDTRPINDSTQIPSEGIHTLYYYSIDRAGNQQTIQNQEFKLDTINPFTTDNSNDIKTLGSTPINLNRLQIIKIGPAVTLNIINNVLEFNFGLSTDLGPFDLNLFTLQDIRDAINADVNYTCTLLTDYDTLLEAQNQPANSLFEVEDLPIATVAPATTLYASTIIKLFPTDTTSGVENTYYTITDDGSEPGTPTTTGIVTISNELVYIRGSSWVFTLVAIGGEVNLKLQNQPIVPNTLTLIKNGSITLIDTVDYTIDNTNGKITLIAPAIGGDTFEASYKYGVVIPVNEDKTYRVKYYTEDQAGNTETEKELINTTSQVVIDKNLPEVTFVPSVAPTVRGWFIINPTIQIIGTATIPATIINIFYRWNGVGSFISTVPPTTTTIPSDGTHTLEAYAVDSLNRVGSVYSEEFKKDEVLPATTDNSIATTINEILIAITNNETEAITDYPYVVIGTYIVYKNGIPLIDTVDYNIDLTTGKITFTAGVTGVSSSITIDYNHLITITSSFNLILSVTDATPSSGFYRTYYEITSDGSLPPNPTLTSPYGTGNLITIPLTTDGAHRIKYYSEDYAGNNESINITEIIRVDPSKPITSLVTTPSSPDGNNNWFINSVLLSFSINANYSGLRTTYYRLSNTLPFQEWNGLGFNLPSDGEYNVEFFSIDLANNIEITKTEIVKQDMVAPITTDDIPVAATSNDTVTLIAIDATSTIDKIYYAVYNQATTLPLASIPVIGEAVAVLTVLTTTLRLNNNFVVSGSYIIYKDGIPLVDTIDYILNLDKGIITLTPPLATGVITADYSYVVDSDGNNEGSLVKVSIEDKWIVKYFAIDLAGNEESIKTAINILNLDLTDPLVENIAPSSLVITDTTEEITFRVRDTGTNPSGIDPFSVRVFVDSVEYSLLKNPEYFIAKVVNFYEPDILNNVAPKQINEIIVPFALGGETTFQLSQPLVGFPIAFNTDQIYINAVIVPKENYTLDRVTGELILTTGLEPADNLIVNYRYIIAFYNIYDFTLCSSTSTSEVFAGGSINYTLANLSIASNSYYVLDNSVPQVEGIDYILNTVTGLITFTVPTTGPVNVDYKYINGPLKTEIENFDVISEIIIDPEDTSGNISAPLTYDFTTLDNEAPFVTEMNPIPNAQDVSLKTGVMFKLNDNLSSVDIKSVNVKVNDTNYFLKTYSAIELKYTGLVTSALLTVDSHSLKTRLNGALDLSLSFYDESYNTISKLVSHINAQSDYTATILDTNLEEEPSTSLIIIENVDITSLQMLESRDLFDTSFVYIPKGKGYLVTVTPEPFENKQLISITIDASDIDGNIMPTLDYQFLTQLGAVKSVDYRLDVHERAIDILDNIKSNMASNYNTFTMAPEFGMFLRIFAHEVGRLKYAKDEVNDLNDFAYMLKDYLYQNFGVLFDAENRLILSNEEYRSYLQSVAYIRYTGSLKANIETGISLYTDADVQVIELFKEGDISEQFMFRIIIDVTTGINTVALIELLNEDLNPFIRQIKPAHTSFTLGFLFKENFGITAGCDFIPLFDVWGSPILDSYGRQLNQLDDSAFIIFNNSIYQIELKDYVLDTTTGQISFTLPLTAGDEIKADYKWIKGKILNETIGGWVPGQTIVYTINKPIVQTSYKLYRNGIEIEEGPEDDYIINLKTGEIILLSPLILGDILTISYWYYEQIEDEIVIASAVGGETVAYLANIPIYDIRFEDGIPLSDFAICDRHWMKFIQLIPYYDYKLKDKMAWFTAYDLDSDLNDIEWSVCYRAWLFPYPHYVGWELIGDVSSNTKVIDEILYVDTHIFGTSVTASQVFTLPVPSNPTHPSTLINSRWNQPFYLYSNNFHSGITGWAHSLAGTDWVDNVDNSVGWTIQFSFELGDRDYDTDYVMVEAHDGTKKVVLEFHNGYIYDSGLGQTLAVIETTRMRTYRIVAKDDEYTFYVDNMHVMVRALSDTTLKKIQWGDYNTPPVESLSMWKYFCYSTEGNFVTEKIPNTRWIIDEDILNIKFDGFSDTLDIDSVSDSLYSQLISIEQTDIVENSEDEFLSAMVLAELVEEADEITDSLISITVTGLWGEEYIFDNDTYQMDRRIELEEFFDNYQDQLVLSGVAMWVVENYEGISEIPLINIYMNLHEIPVSTVLANTFILPVPIQPLHPATVVNTRWNQMFYLAKKKYQDFVSWIINMFIEDEYESLDDDYVRINIGTEGFFSEAYTGIVESYIRRVYVANFYEYWGVNHFNAFIFPIPGQPMSSPTLANTLWNDGRLFRGLIGDILISSNLI